MQVNNPDIIIKDKKKLKVSTLIYMSLTSAMVFEKTKQIHADETRKNVSLKI